MEPSAIVKAVLDKLGNENLISELTSRLSQSELTTLLLGLSKEATARRTPNDLLRHYETNRFVKPSKLNPIDLKRIELAMLELAERGGFAPVELSPASPLGSCSVIAKVDQDKVISATRGVELLSDSTNMLAIYLANGLKNGTIDNSGSGVHVCAACRVTRGQRFGDPNAVPHFGLFALVSSGKDTGSYRFELEAMTKHLEFYIDYFEARLGNKAEAVLRRRKGYTDSDGFMDRMYAHLSERFPSCSFIDDRGDSDNGYYQGMNFKINVNGVSIADGGFVDWTQRLLGTKKERLLISGAGIDVQLLTGIIA